MPQPTTAENRTVSAIEQCEEIWHRIAALALRAGDVPRAYAACLEYARDIDRIHAEALIHRETHSL